MRTFSLGSLGKFLVVLIVIAAVSAASSRANAGGYYGGYGGYYEQPYYDEPYYDRGYYPAAYGYGPAYGASHYGLAGLLLPFLWGGDSWGPPDDYCHQRVRVYDNWGGWVWGHRVVC